jgi:hypothetical protein
VAEIVLDVPRLGLPTLVVMSIHLCCKYAKKPVAGPHALAEALDTAQRRLSELGSPSLDIVCGDINMARPPLSSFKYMALSRFGRSSGFFSRRSSAMLRAAPLPCCSALLPCCSALLLAAQCCPRCAALPRLENRRTLRCGTTPLWMSSRTAVSCQSPIGPESVASSASANRLSHNSSCRAAVGANSLKNKSEEERDAVWKKFLTQCGANLTSPGLSVHSGALVRVLVFVHHMLLFRLVDVGLLGKAKHLITLADGRSEVHF